MKRDIIYYGIGVGACLFVAVKVVHDYDLLPPRDVSPPHQAVQAPAPRLQEYNPGLEAAEQAVRDAELLREVRQARFEAWQADIQARQFRQREADRARWEAVLAPLR